MQKFADGLNVADFSPEDGSAALAIDDIPFGFICSESGDELTILADLGQQPGSADRPLGSVMLKANFLYETLHGAVFYLNPENDSFGIQQRFRLVDLDPASLAEHVERLANLAEEWRAIVAGYGHIEAAAKEMSAGEKEMDPLQADGFMRV
ncbi:MAG: type III secretion system chaperone [Kiritimatiellae bacterium]|nr:type III secretion system chaperone [Kiritimatiellia bacterium]